MDVMLPPDPELQALEDFAVAQVRQAGQLLLERFGQAIPVEYKGQRRREPVTAVDREVESLVRQPIRERYPDHDLLSEETASEPRASPPAYGISDYLWVLDPLDGTANFIGGLPLFAVSLDLLYQGRPVVGSIFLPPSATSPQGVYHARRGGGAYFEGAPLKASAAARLCGLSLGARRRFVASKAMRQRQDEARSLGSICYELALVARGTFQYAVFARPHIWDVAAGVLLVAEAGGRVLGRHRGAWEPLEAFAPPPSGKLREWSGAVMAGAPEAVGFLKGNLRPRRNPWQALLARLRRRSP